MNLGRGAAELVIIAMGVLVALAGDAAVDRARDRDRESDYLRSLFADVSADLSSLESRSVESDRRREAQDEFLSVLRGERQIADSSALVLQLRVATNFGTFDAQTSTFEDMLSTGGLELIEDDVIRRRILDYYHLVEDLRETESSHRLTVLAAFQEHIPAAFGSTAVAMSFEQNNFQSGEPVPDRDPELRSEAARTFRSGDETAYEHFRRFVVVSRSLGAKSRLGHLYLRRAGEALRSVLVPPH